MELKTTPRMIRIMIAMKSNFILCMDVFGFSVCIVEIYWLVGYDSTTVPLACTRRPRLFIAQWTNKKNRLMVEALATFGSKYSVSFAKLQCFGRIDLLIARMFLVIVSFLNNFLFYSLGLSNALEELFRYKVWFLVFM